jgi:hypothetical protein
MARFSNEIQPHEVRAYQQFCIDHNILLDGDVEAYTANANLVRDYFTKTWNEVITPETLATAFSQLRPHLKFKSTARLEFEKLASQEPDRATQLDLWLQDQGGKPGQLVNSLYGDETYENLTALLIALCGYDITPERIRDAEDRIAHRTGKQLHRVPQPRRTEPVSQAAKEDNGEPFVTSGLTKQKDGSLGKSPADYAREARERSEKNNPSPSQTPALALDASEQAWKAMADGLLSDGTHSQQARVRAVYDREQGNGWRRVYEACKKEARSSSRSIR